MPPLRDYLRERPLTRLAAWAALSSLVLAVAIGLIQSGYSNAELADGLNRPGLALEVPNSPEQFYEVVGLPGDNTDDRARDRTIARLAQYVDFALIPSYVLLYAAAGLLQFAKMSRFWGVLGCVGVLLAVVAGFCDIQEDRHILAAIRGIESGAAVDAGAISFWGWSKWELMFVATFFASPLLLDRSSGSLGRSSALLRWCGLGFGVVMILSGFFGLVACWYRHRVRLADALSGTAVLTIYFWPLWVLFRDGVLEGFDRMAGWRLFRWLSRWPTVHRPPNPGT